MKGIDPNESLGFQCNLTVKAFVNSLEKRLKGTGVSPSQHRALAHLIALGPLPLTDLVKRLGIATPTGVRLVDRMERDGWVTREPDPEDSRRKMLVPTEKAHEVWATISVVSKEMLDQAYQGVLPEEIERVIAVLERVRGNLSSSH